jgi:hypothetical protein
VQSQVSHSEIRSALIAKLEATHVKLTDFSKDNDRAAGNVLRAFIQQVNAQSGKKIPAEDGAALIKAAGELIALLDGDGDSNGS